MNELFIEAVIWGVAIIFAMVTVAHIAAEFDLPFIFALLIMVFVVIGMVGVSSYFSGKELSEQANDIASKVESGEYEKISAGDVIDIQGIPYMRDGDNKLVPIEDIVAEDKAGNIYIKPESKQTEDSPKSKLFELDGKYYVDVGDGKLVEVDLPDDPVA